jgi:hypothetical protein
MKRVTLLFAIIGFASATLEADPPKQITKTSRKLFDIKAEVKEFYLRLLKSDSEVQKQVKSLTAGDGGDVHPLHSSPPYVLRWIPVEENWNVGTGIGETTARYLVIQTMGYARSRYSEDTTALIAEFEVIEKSTSTKPVPKHETDTPKILSDSITIKFLGLRDPNLVPLAKP